MGRRTVWFDHVSNQSEESVSSLSAPGFSYSSRTSCHMRLPWQAGSHPSADRLNLRRVISCLILALWWRHSLWSSSLSARSRDDIHPAISYSSITPRLFRPPFLTIRWLFSIVFSFDLMPILCYDALLTMSPLDSFLMYRSALTSLRYSERFS